MSPGQAILHLRQPLSKAARSRITTLATKGCKTSFQTGEKMREAVRSLLHSAG
jgi:hypothetical protein